MKCRFSNRHKILPSSPGVLSSTVLIKALPNISAEHLVERLRRVNPTWAVFAGGINAVPSMFDCVITGVGTSRLRLRIESQAIPVVWEKTYSPPFQYDEIIADLSREGNFLMVRDAANDVLKSLDVSTLSTLMVHEFIAYAKRAESKRRWNAETVNEIQFWYFAALGIDPKNLVALSGLAMTYQYLAAHPWWHNTEISELAMRVGLSIADKVMTIDPGYMFGYAASGMLHSLAGNFANAAEFFDKIIVGGDVSEKVIAQTFLGVDYVFQGQWDLALHSLERAILLAERMPFMERRLAAAYAALGFAYTLRENYSVALQCLKSSLKMVPGYDSAYLVSIAAASLANHPDASRTVVGFRRVFPNLNSDQLYFKWGARRSIVSSYLSQIGPIIDIIKQRTGMG